MLLIVLRYENFRGTHLSLNDGLKASNEAENDPRKLRPFYSLFFDEPMLLLLPGSVSCSPICWRVTGDDQTKRLSFVQEWKLDADAFEIRYL